MSSAVRKIIVFFIFGTMALLVWNFFVPYVKSMTRQSLNDRLSYQILSDKKDSVDVAFASSQLMIDIASTEPERVRGLGGKLFLDEDRGMLFVFDKPGYYAIWMKDMLFPIDVVWLDEGFRIVDIQKDISPATYPKSFEPDFPARYILEVNAGYLESHGISLGDVLTLMEEDREI